MTKLPLSFYQQTDVLELSCQLLGKNIFSQIEGVLTGGMIVETEAYRAPEDRASHAYGMRRTKRNEAMYLAGGHSYVYICYGIYPLLNIVTNQVDVPHAILIRAIEPKIGIEQMLKRRNKCKLERNLTAGPGVLTQALGINSEHNGVPLNGPLLWLEESGVEILSKDIMMSPRVGVAYAQEDALLPWRFRLRTSIWTSPAK